ncbi:MAG TPA: MBL fold metallo-hydrolase [Clostridiaceae bacterium]|nr:MBL fold metallo-hydrolase [Clostridiaceae bacterium]
MVLKRLPTGMLASNCYIIGDSGEGAIIDPGADSGEILKAVEEMGLKIKYIILTHAHVDHICSVDKVREKTGAQVMVHKDDAEALTNSRYNGSMLFGLNKTFKPADILLEDGDIVNIGQLKLEIIHTPGHTPGGICIKAENCVFTGDTLFRMSIGRTDLGNGNYDDLMDSINKLMKLDGETVVYPGHGTSTTIEYEKMYNPFIV